MAPVDPPASRSTPVGNAHPSTDKSLIDKLASWYTLIAGLAGAIALLAAFVYPFKDVEVTALVKQTIPVNLADVEGFPVVLQIKQPGKDKEPAKEVKRATVVHLEVRNTGQKEVGEKGKTWDLKILSQVGSSGMVVAGATEKDPQGLTAEVITTDPNEILLRIGLFNPRDSVQLKLILLDPKNELPLPVRVVVAEGSRQPGLSEVITTNKSHRSRIAEAYATGIWVLVFVAIMWGAIRLQWHFEKTRGESKLRAWQWALITLFVLVVSGAAAWQLSEATGWVVERASPR